MYKNYHSCAWCIWTFIKQQFSPQKRRGACVTKIYKTDIMSDIIQFFFTLNMLTKIYINISSWESFTKQHEMICLNERHVDIRYQSIHAERWKILNFWCKIIILKKLLLVNMDLSLWPAVNHAVPHLLSYDDIHVLQFW